MSRKCKILRLLLLTISFVPLVFCDDLIKDSYLTNVSSYGFAHKLLKATRFMEDFKTDASGYVSLIPFHVLYPIRYAIDPVLGAIGLAVDSIKSKSDLLANKAEKIEFRLYSDRRDNESYWNLVPEDDKSIKSSYFMKTRPIKILIHGFQNDGRTEFPQKIKNAYLKYTNYNVIVVDWGQLSYAPLNIANWVFTYPAAVRNLITVSYRVSDLIVSLQRNGVIRNPKEIHFVGFSLGAHISGQAGFFVRHRLGAQIGRITGLDPAGPLLETSKMDFRLDKSDAKFVDVIHTSQLGMYAPMGHADFYPNGGSVQQECYDGFNAYQNPIRALNDFKTLCSHTYSYELFTLSIKNWEIYGCTCNSWANYKRHCKNNCKAEAILGEYCPSIVKGIFFLDTRLPPDFYHLY